MSTPSTADIRTLVASAAVQGPPSTATLGKTLLRIEREACEGFDAWLAQVRRDAIEPARLIHDRDHARAVKLGAVCPSCEAWEALETALEES